MKQQQYIYKQMKFILKILNKLNLLKYINVNTKINVENQSIVIPVIGSTGYNNLNISESWMLKILELLNLSSDKLIVDVGVNIGQTLIKIKTTYPKMEYIGFDPNPFCVFYLKKLISANNWENTNIIPSGVANYSGIEFLDYYSDDITDSSASIITDYRKKSTVYKRDIVTLLEIERIDKLFKDKVISAIKIDVEGAELGVIESFVNKISEDRPFLLVEILPVYNKNNISRINSQIKIEKILKNLNYQIYPIHKGSTNQFKKLENIMSIGIHENLNWCDYIVSPITLEV
ncbi:MAG: FkbM family methyltransferase [Marinicellaceae bacterium]